MVKCIGIYHPITLFKLNFSLWLELLEIDMSRVWTVTPAFYEKEKNMLLISYI